MKRLISAFQNSINGLKHGFVHETAIRQEILLLIFSLIAAPAVTFDLWRMLAMIGAVLFILFAELLNTGIEQVANRLTREFSPEIKVAKDCGSAAVLVAAVVAAGVWAIVLWEAFVRKDIAPGWLYSFI